MGGYSAWKPSAAIYEEFFGRKVQDVSREEIAAIRSWIQEKIAEQTDELSFVNIHHAMMMDRGY